jgi:SAM-dependent methyltransferase
MKRSFDEGQRRFWQDRCNVRPHDHPVVRAFAVKRVRLIGRLLGHQLPSSALEVGCGDGFGTQHMRQLTGDLYGCDLSESMLRANRTAAGRLVRADAYSLPFRDASFELVYCWDLLHHVAEPRAVVREMARTARRWVVLCEPNCLNPAMALFGLLSPGERGLLGFTPGRVKRLLRGAGLEHVMGLTAGWFTPNRTPLWLARLLGVLPNRLPLVGLYGAAVGHKNDVDVKGDRDVSLERTGIGERPGE